MAERGNGVDISVIIPVRDDIERLRRCLAALEGQTYPRDRFEVIVVDNGSTEPLRTRLGEGGIVADEPVGGSYAARNRGIELARGDLLAFTDSDCIPAPDWIERGAAHAESGAASLVAGNVSLFLQDEAPTAVELYELIFAFPQEEYVRDHNFGVTANLFVRKATADDIGGFDPALESGGDYEFCRRAVDAGYAIAYSEDAVVEHPARREWEQLRSKVVRVEAGNAKLGRSVPIALWRVALPDGQMLRRVWSTDGFGVVAKLKASGVVLMVSWLRNWLRFQRRGATK